MEPLISNIEANEAIEKITSVKLGTDLPKAYTYADDLNCTVKRSSRCLQAIFDEYSRLTKLAGLELNADKTEIIRFASELRATDFRAISFDIRYLGVNYTIKTIKETKVNGIFLQQDEEALKHRNVENVREKIDAQFKRWSRRSLSTLGKILIVKTFGISQIIYLMQSLTLEKKHFKTLNDILYKFIWNKRYQASKAPDRVKREYMNLSVKNGGFGMLDVVELDKSLKLRSLGRLLVTKHPALSILKDKLDLTDFFFPNFDKTIDSYVARGVELLKEDRHKLWGNSNRCNDIKFVGALKSLEIRNIVKPAFKNSLTYFFLRRDGIRKVGQLDHGKLNQIKNHLCNENLSVLIGLVLPLRVPDLVDSDMSLYLRRGKWVDLSKLTSKEIRQARSEELPMCVFKCGLLMNPGEALSLFKALNSLTSTVHKNSILRYIHGDIYSKERLYRFGMADNPNCESCGAVEDINHKILECGYSKGIWQALMNRLNTQTTVDPNFVAGAHEHGSRSVLTLHAEIIRLLIGKERLTHLTPEANLDRIIRQLVKKEKGTIKTELGTLLR